MNLHCRLYILFIRIKEKTNKPNKYMFLIVCIPSCSGRYVMLLVLTLGLVLLGTT
jgi:hypothetical protein